MAYDLEEQEQLDEFKAWWKKNGSMVTNLALAALIAYSAWQGYHWFQNKEAAEASGLYQGLVVTDLAKTAEIKAQSAKLMENFAGTPYAGRAAVFAAKANFAANDSKSAKAQLEWAVKNAKESAVQAIAGLQLAGILFEEKNYDEAQKVLAAINDKGYEGLKASLQGDVLLAQGKNAEAKKAYQTALENLDSQGRMHQYTQQKLESLGV
ncbi:MAG TPA: tetratricopeptide repeat protein [Methylotenera sp.]|nr:tetratricopeptide repeat protein [Methylotenera sp.]HPV45107.1 tetratricopeptide repeat protein [Methylotenera sp.]